VLVDGVPLEGTATTDGKGSFTITIAAPSEPGYHRVSVRMAGDEPEIDAAMFLVKN
jgi:phosphatidate phosphatase APP1